MEKLYKFKFLISLLLLISTATVFAQIPNPGFENWTPGSCTVVIITNNYDDPTGWGSINVLTCPGGGFTCNQATGADVHSGSYALELSTISIFGQTAPGIIATGVINQSTQNVDGGFALSTRPDKLIGWYKYQPSPPDTFSVSVDIFSGPTTGTPIAANTITGSNAVSTYTKFIVNIPYTSSATPDSAKITILSSPGQTGNPGTNLFIDDLAFVSCSGFAASPTKVNATCTSATGSITLAAPVNGTAPYSYAWSNGSTATSLSSLVPGTYKVTITDGNTCVTIDTVTIADNNVAFTVTDTGSVTSCTSNTGTAVATASGGTSPYSYHWSNNSTATQLTGLGAGNYPVTVTDAHGCTSSATSSVLTPNGPSATDSVVANVNCFGQSTGAVAVTVTGGTSPINYVWSNGATTGNITGLSAGPYTVTITDHNNCSFEVSATITQPSAAVSVADSIINNICFGNSTGTAGVLVSGGTSPYTYSWTGGATTASVSNLAAGNYSVTVTDFNQCTASSTLSITQPTNITATITVTNASSANATNGAETVSASGGTGTLSYNWVTGATADSITHLSPGAYCVTITDANACSVSACDTVGFSVGINAIASVLFKIYPNPASSQLTIETNSADGKFLFNVFSLDGRLVEQTTVAGEKTTLQLRQFADGFYTYQLKDMLTGAINYGKIEIQR